MCGGARQQKEAFFRLLEGGQPSSKKSRLRKQSRGEQVGEWVGGRPAETQTETQARKEVREDALPRAVGRTLPGSGICRCKDPTSPAPGRSGLTVSEIKEATKTGGEGAGEEEVGQLVKEVQVPGLWGY